LCYRALVNALFLLSKITPTTAVGVLEDFDGHKSGIFFNRGMPHAGPEFSTMLYAHFPLFEIGEIGGIVEYENGDLRNFKVHVAEWPLVLIPSTKQFVEAIALLPAKKDDYVDVRLLHVKIKDDPNLIETQIIISGMGNANTGAGMKHPLELNDNVTETKLSDPFYHYA
jgi:hypothetical protein